MRNSEAQKYARWSLAVAGLLAVIVTGVYARNTWLARQAEKKAPPPVPSTIQERSNEFSYSKVEGQRTIYTVKASHTTAFKEGSRNLLEDVAIFVYGKSGDRNDTLRTNACDFISSTGQISCAGDVQINLQAAGPNAGANAVRVATSGLTFDRATGEARTDKPVTFHWPAGDGHSVGVSYDSNNGTLRMIRNVQLNLSTSPADASGQPNTATENNVHVAGDSMTFQRDARVVQMLGSVHAQQDTIELTAEKLQLELDSELQPKRFLASGHPQVHDVSPDGPMSLSADEIASNMRTDGSVQFLVASGNVHGTRDTSIGGETIEAGRVQVNLATQDNVPRLVEASNGVTLTSTNAAFNGGTRHVVTDALEIHFAKSVGAVGPTRMESVNTLAPAAVDWQNVALVNGKSVPQSTRMAGQRMNLKFNGQNKLEQLLSTGGVEVHRKLGEDPEETTTSHELKAKFDKNGEWSTIDQTGDVHFHDATYTGQGDHAHVDRANNAVTLDGSVLFADATMQTTAQSAAVTSVNSGSNLLRADGHVMTTDLHASTPSISNLSQQPAHISAEHLVADSAKGHAIYSGKARMWQGETVIEAESIELDHPTQVLLAKGNVRGVFPQAAWNPKPRDAASVASLNLTKTTLPVTPSKPTATKARSGPQLGHVRGGLLTYWEAESKGRIEQGARVDSEQGSIQADRIDLYFSDGGAANSTKQLTRSVANGAVTVSQQDRRGTSDKAEYTASEGKFVLSEGKPTLYSSTGDTTTGRQLTFFFADDRILVDSADGARTVTLHQVEK
jgi:lipopolysaccharide export system protein LptA